MGSISFYKSMNDILDEKERYFGEKDKYKSIESLSEHVSRIWNILKAEKTVCNDGVETEEMFDLLVDYLIISPNEKTSNYPFIYLIGLETVQ